MAEGSLSASAIIRRTMPAQGGVLFSDDFERVVAGGLGNGWTGYWGDPPTANVGGGCWYQTPRTYSAWGRDDVVVPVGGSFDISFDFYIPPWTSFSSGWRPYTYLELGGTWFEFFADIPTGGPPLAATVRLSDAIDGTITFQDVQYEDDSWYTFRVAQLNGRSNLKIWKTGDPEPVGWTYSGIAYESSWALGVELDGVDAADGKLDNFVVHDFSTPLCNADAIILLLDIEFGFAAGAEISSDRPVSAEAVIRRTVERSQPFLPPEFVGATRATSWSKTSSLSVLLPNGALESDCLIAVSLTDSDGGGNVFLPSGWVARSTIVYPDGSSATVFKKTTWYAASLPVTIWPASGANVILLAFRNVDSIAAIDADTTNQSPYDTIVAPPLDVDLTGMLVSVFASASWGPGAMTPPAGMTEAIDSTDYYVQLGAAYLPITDAGEAAVPRTVVISNPDSGSPWRTGFSILLTRGDPNYSFGTLVAGIPVGAYIYKQRSDVAAISIKLDGVDITGDVMIGDDAEFVSQASGAPGTCKFRVKDMDFHYQPVAGKSLTLDINGRRVWGGWATKITRQHPFIATTAEMSVFDPCIPPDRSIPRFYTIEGVDYNILFRKRFVVKKSDPSNGVVKTWPKNTSDSEMIDWLCRHNLYLEDDGIDSDSMVETVGTPNPDARGNPAGPGWSWEQAMQSISRLPGAIFYIDPDRRLVYTDVDSPNTNYVLTDDPKTITDIGYRDMEILNNGANLVNDAMVWGAGQGDSKVKFSRARDTASLNEHGLWQVGDFRTDMYRQASVDKRAQSFVYGSPQNKRGGKDDAVSVMATVFAPFFRVADKVQFVSTVFGYSDVLPVRRVRITFPTPSSARFSLVLSHAIDEPWDTSEFWFPRPKIDPIVVDPGGGDPYCPVPVLTGDPTTIDDLDSPAMTLVFADDMSRRDVLMVDLDGGWWGRAAGGSPSIANDRVMIPYNAYYPLLLFLDTPVSGDMQAILKLDLSEAYIFSSWNPLWGAAPYLLSFETTNSMFRLWADGGVGALDSSSLDLSQRVVPSFGINQRIYIRLLVNRRFDYTAVKVWPQDTIEPAAWTVISPGTPVGDAGKISFWCQANGVYLEAIAIWGSPMAVDPDEGYPRHPLADRDEGNWPTNGGWTRTFDCTGNKSGIAGADDTVSWDVDSLSHSGNGSTSFSAVADYFDPKKGYMHRARASVGVVDFSYGASADPPPMYAAEVPLPDRISITGTINASCNLSTFIADNRVKQVVSIPVELYIIPQSFVDPSTPPGFYPYSAVGRVVKTVLATVVTNSGAGSSAQIPFNVNLPFTEYIDPAGYGLRWFYIGVRIQDPKSILTPLNYSGGPFMMPNTAGLDASVTVEKVGFDYDIVGGGEYFCVPAGQVDGSSAKNTKTIIVDAVYLRDLYAMGERWQVDLGPYVPSSVTITADGLDLVSGYDFIEEDPASGLIAFVHSMLNVSEVVVYYLPSI